VVREYGVDWILQDGVNPVKVCTKRTHTHNARNSNYSNSVHGLDDILAAIGRQAPQVVCENCQSGGRMMTFQMVRANVTSITSDDSSALTTRQAIHGATYPFSPRYTDRYLGEDLVSKYNLRSGMFGGPWMLMQRITEWSEADIALAAAEAALYKSLRPIIRDGKVFHLTPRPDGTRNEAIQAHSARLNRSVIFVFRHESEEDSLLVQPRGLLPRSEYRVRLQDAGTVEIATGRDLMERGVRVPLIDMDSAEIVLLTPASVDEASA
jgi:alpha-galactosidase